MPNFCPYCGKPIGLPDAVFCPHCGKSLKPGAPGAASAKPVSAVPEYEYKDFVLTWSNYTWTYGKLIGDATTTANIWSNVQHSVMEHLNEWLSDGWEPLTPIGPSSLTIEFGTKFNLAWMTTDKTARLRECRIKMRRLKG